MSLDELSLNCSLLLELSLNCSELEDSLEEFPSDELDDSEKFSEEEDSLTPSDELELSERFSLEELSEFPSDELLDSLIP